MTTSPYDCTGWDAIATALGVSPRTAQRWYMDHLADDDPLPANTWRGRVRARSAELHAWLERRVEPTRRRGVG